MNTAKWVSIWGNAMSIAEHRPEGYAKDITLRYPVYIPFSGEALRFTFDNYCGKEPIVISKATVAVFSGSMTERIGLTCPVEKSTISDITFFSSSDVTILPKDFVVSDPVYLNVAAGDAVCISIYFSKFTSMQSAVLITGPLSKGFFSFGNQTAEPLLPINETKSTNWFYFLSNIELFTSSENHSVICYGDSITAQSWPDYLTLRTRENTVNHTAIVRRAASGTRILRQYECITYDSYGLKGKNRFSHEAPVSGADTIIIQQGINDIIHPVGSNINPFRPMSDLPTAAVLIDGLKWYIEESRKLHYKVYLGTLLPIRGWRTFEPFREEIRHNVNTWIRSSSEIDGFIDFDYILRDDDEIPGFKKEYDSGDHLHPSSKGYRDMALAVPKALIY